MWFPPPQSHRITTEALIAYINQFWADYGHGPSVGDMARHFGVSRQAVYQRVTRLIQRGVLEWHKSVRGTRLTGTLKVKAP